MQSPYEILGLPRDATEQQIKAAFRREASKAHPDRPGGNQARMTAVNEAHSVGLRGRAGGGSAGKPSSTLWRSQHA